MPPSAHFLPAPCPGVRRTRPLPRHVYGSRWSLSASRRCSRRLRLWSGLRYGTASVPAPSQSPRAARDTAPSRRPRRRRERHVPGICVMAQSGRLRYQSCAQRKMAMGWRYLSSCQRNVLPRSFMPKDTRYLSVPRTLRSRGTPPRTPAQRIMSIRLAGQRLQARGQFPV